MISFFAQAQTDTRFWFAAPDVSNSHGDAPIQIVVSAFDVPATVTVTQPANLAFPTYIVVVAANSSQIININPSKSLVETPFDVFGGFPDVSKTGLLVESTAKITAYYEVNNNTNNDIFALKGKNGLGLDFYVPFQDKWRHQPGLADIGRSGFVVVATEDATIIAVTPTTALEGGQAAGATFFVNLNKGETYVGSVREPAAGNFPAGSHITSNKPIAVTKFSDSINTGTATSPSGCYDLAGDQLIPINILGTEYVVLRGQLNNPELVVITAIAANTQVRVNGGLVATLGVGQTHTYELNAARVFVTTTRPAYVGHYAGFGCETGFAILPPVTCTGSLTTRITRSTNEAFIINLMTRGAPAGNLNFTNNFTIKVSNGGTTTILFDTNPITPFPSFPQAPTVFSQIGTSDYYATQYEFSLAQVPVGAVVTIESTTVTPITNEAGLFHLGYVNGGAGTGTRYGYFSDFRSLDLGEDVNINYGTNTTITADIAATSFKWYSDGVLDPSQTTNVFTVTNIQRRQTIRVEATVGGCILKSQICVGTLEYVWDGSIITVGDLFPDIDNPNNWSKPCGLTGVPKCDVDIIIPPTPIASSTLTIPNGKTLNVRNITILNNGNLNVKTGGQVNVCGNMVHDGNLVMQTGSTFSFIGKGRQNYSKGTTGLGDFENLVIASDPDPTNISTFNAVIGLTILPSTNPASAQDLSVSATGSIRFQKGYITPEGFPAANGVDNSRTVIVKNPSPTAITGFAGPTNPLSPNTTSTEYFIAGKLNRAKNANGYYSFPVGVITQPVSKIEVETNKDGVMISFNNNDWLKDTYGTVACDLNNGVLRMNKDAEHINFSPNTGAMAVAGGAARTVEIWAKVTDFNGGGLFQFGSSTVPNGDFALVTIPSVVGDPTTNNNWGIRLNNGFTLDLINLPNSFNTWNHYALTYNGNPANPQVSFYYNGLIIRTYDLRDAFNNPVPLATVLTNGLVGRWSGTSSNGFRGEIDELKIWTENRTAAQIKESFEQGCASNALQCPQANNLKAYYNFEDANIAGVKTVRTIQSRTIQCPVPVFSYQRADADFNVPNAVANVTASFKKYVLVPPAPNTGQTGICGVDFNLDPALNNGFWNFSSFNAANTPVPVTTAYKMYLFNRDYSNFSGLSTTVMQLAAGQNPYGVSPPWTIPPGLCETNGPHLTGRSGFTGNMGFFGTAQSKDVTLLPIELLSITATPKENAILVEWATLQEKDNYGFEVFRADENGDFVKIGFVKGKDNSTTRQDYQFLDIEVEPNINYYYKLKQIDNNGKFNFTKTVTAKLSDSDFTGEQINTIYPNPTDDEFTLYLGGKEFKNAKQIQISLVNAIGEELERKTIYSQSGNRITFRLTRYPKGVYLLRIVTETSSAVMKVVKE